MPTITLSGCAPIPLAHYLKALGILRIVSEQHDPGATGAWVNDRLLLRTAADTEALQVFFAENYKPTPVLAPWNGGSGFFPKDNHLALLAIEDSTNIRLEPYRQGIRAARRALVLLGLEIKPEGEKKSLLLQNCRNSFPEDALGWLDAVYVLGHDGAKFPPLLGTGGNDGRLEFTNNFMQRVVELIDPSTGRPTAESGLWLNAALFGGAVPGSVAKAPVGQFFPGAAGGANATAGFDAPAAVNPWDFILMIEGALLFAAATVKRLENDDGDSALVYPFCVRQTGVGYASASVADESDARCEMWMPLWTRPTTLLELRTVFGEGRAQVRGRNARNGVDFTQAAVTLGVDRGITAFQRYGFQVRNGLSYFATPLDRVIVRRNARADLLADIEHWHERLRQKAGPRANPEAPASIVRALNQVERCIIELCRDGSASNLQTLLAALGRAEQATARSLKWTVGSYLRPLHGLRKRWIEDADDNTPEFRLAQSLAGMRAPFGQGTHWFRQHLEPVKIGENGVRSWTTWEETPGGDVAWHDGELSDALNAILARRLVMAEKLGSRGWPDWSPRPASLRDVTEFIEGRTNDKLLADLIWGLSLVDWESVVRSERQPERLSQTGSYFSPNEYSSAQGDESLDTQLSFDAESRRVPSSFYSLLRLCFRRTREIDHPVPLVPAILRRAMNGDGQASSALAARRLRASGKVPLVTELPLRDHVSRRTAAAILFPIASRDFRLLESIILKPIHQKSA